MEYLSVDEQFKETLNNEEISRIQDPELRDIRSKYWGKRHKAFLAEYEIPDSELGKVFDRLIEEERKELEAYKTRHGFN